MATAGYTTTPTFGNWGEGFNFGDQVALTITMPAVYGRITNIHCYAAAFTGTATMILAIWDSGGNVLASCNASSSIGTTPAWITGALATPLLFTPSQSIFVGWCNPNNTSSNNGFLATYDSVAGWTAKWNFQSPVPQNILTGTNATQLTSHAIGSYVDYTQSNLFVRRSSGWQNTILKVNRSGVEIIPSVKIRRNGLWVQIQ